MFPDTLEKLFGVGYNFKGTWSVTRWTFEALTLGTLAVILLVGILGYSAGAGVRAQSTTVAIDEGEAATLPA